MALDLKHTPAGALAPPDSPPVTLADVRDARARIADTLLRTPLAPSPQLGAMWDCQVAFKLESLHQTGSFKERGALNKLLTLTDQERACGIIAASAGNHAQAVAHHAKRLGIPATIVMPINAPLVKVQNTEASGARVILLGANYDEALAHARELGAQEGLTFVHGFDDPAIIAGQGTLGLELLEQDPLLEVVLIPVGGGGLLSGTVLALKETKPDIRVIGVQFEGIPSMKAALAAGYPVAVAPQPTIADGIAVCHAGKMCLDLTQRYVDEIVTVTEEEIAGAVLLLLEREKAVVEGAGAVGVAAIHNCHVDVAGRRVAVVLSGGNIDVTRISRVIAHGLAKDGRLARLRVTVPDVPGYLARILNTVASMRGNILEVDHDRAFFSGSVNETTIDLTIETRGREHIEEIAAKLTADGLKVTRRK